MKKVISMLLCLTMLLSAVTLLASCSKKDEITPKISKKVIDINLTDYAIVCGSELTDGGRQQVGRFATKLRELTSVPFRVQQDSEAEAVETSDLEILIGQTNRVETQKALKKVKGQGWTVRVFDNKLVIVGTTPLLTRVALSWVTETYLNAESAQKSVLSVNQKVVLDKMATITLTGEDGEGKYTIVYNDSVDDDPNGENYATDLNPTGGMATDYIYDVSVKVRSLLASTTGSKVSTFPYKLASAEATNEEVLVGNMNRTEMKEELAKLEADEYAVTVRNGKIMIAAWNDVTLASAHALFEDLLKGSAITDDEGNSSYAIPANCTVKDTLLNDWVTDFPKPDGENIALDGTVDVGDNSIEYIYSGSGVNRESYVAYCEKLESAGFKALAAETQWEGSSFRTYLNQETGVTLHVYHSAYAHAKEQNVTDVLNSIRIIASNTDSVSLPGAEILKPQTAGVDYQPAPYPQSKVTTIDIAHSADNWGLAQIITLADGSFVIIDGAHGKTTEDDKANMWRVLNELYEDSFGEGQTPTAEKPIHVRAWILTHEHGDHFRLFTEFLKAYGSSNLFKFDYFLFNAASESERYNSNNPETKVQESLDTLKGYVKNGFTYLKVHTGQVFYMANCKFEVLYTHEDIYPKKTEFFNNTTSVIRTVLTETKDGKTHESGCVWLGDVERIGSRRMRAMYGDFMQSEMVQVSHHGSNGVESALYELIKPTVVWWPSSESRFKSWGAKVPTASSDWRHKVDYQLCHMDSVHMVIMADGYTTTMTITADGPQLSGEGLYDAKTGLPITPDGTNVINMKASS